MRDCLLGQLWLGAKQQRRTTASIVSSFLSEQERLTWTSTMVLGTAAPSTTETERVCDIQNEVAPNTTYRSREQSF